MTPFRKPLTLLLVISICCSLGVVADDLGRDDSDWDRIWDYTRLYEADRDDQFIQDVVLSGRLQAEYFHFRGDTGEELEDLVWRRFRFGGEVGLVNNWVAHLEGDFNLNNSVSDWYDRLTDAYIGYKPGKHLDLRMLKHSAGFTLDGATSSKRLLTLQRNNLTNNLWFTEEYFTGVSIKGESESGITYRTGLYSNDPSDEISRFEARGFFLGSVGRDLSDSLGIEQAEVRLDYVYNEEHPDSNTRPFSNVVSLVTLWQGATWGLRSDLSAGRGYGEQSDIWGLVVMPIYRVNRHWQWIARYTFIDSAGPDGIRLGRYEREFIEGSGDRYNELYAGVNYFFYGHKFKLQLGGQYNDLAGGGDDGGDHHDWGITAGFRMSW